jgi:serine/threonine protein kinase/Mg-chelatase subunit ChlD
MVATNTRLWQLADDERAVVEAWLAEFDQSWDEGRLATRAAALPSGPLRLVALVEMVKIDLEHNWQRGRRVAVEDYLSAYPELGTTDTAALDLLMAESEARRAVGDASGPGDLARRFPARADEIRNWSGPEAGPPAASASTAERNPYSTTPLGPRPAPVGELPDVFGRYRLVRKVGQGGMGAVWLAQDTQLGRSVALKVPHFSPGDGPEMLERFYREARAAAAIRHPHVCPVYDVGQINGVHYLTMAYIDGPPLSDLIRGRGPLPAAPAAALARQLAQALQVAHGLGIVHRDLKPGNVLVGADGEPAITDFGLARRVEAGEERLTRSGAILGTPPYMSPEQVEGTGEVGPASDVYSLGVMLYELLTGRPPFAGPLTEVLWQVRFKEPERPSALRPDLDPQLEAIVMRALAKKPEGRYATMAAFAADLDDYLKKEEARSGPVNRLLPYLRQAPAATKVEQAPPPPPATPTERPPRKPNWQRWIAAGLLGVLAVVAAAIVIRYRDKDGKEREVKLDVPPDSSVRVYSDDGKKIVDFGVPNDKDAPRDGPALITVKDVVDMLKGGAKEKELLDRLDESPTQFVLGEDEIKQLKAAGASEALLNAMERKAARAKVLGDCTEIVVILDCSGSMNDKTPDGKTKMDAAKHSVTQLIESIPKGRKLAFIVYGHDLTRQCQAVDVVQPLAELDDTGKRRLKDYIAELKPVGHTPIALALEKAGKELAKGEGLSAIFLITDGMETCHGIPAAVAAELVAKNKNLKGGVNVVAFDVDPKESEQVRAIAREGKGDQYTARNAEQLSKQLGGIERVVAKKPISPDSTEGLSAIDKALFEDLRDKSADVRIQAIQKLGQRKVMAVVPHLVEIVATDETRVVADGFLYPDVKDAALKVLKKLAPEKVFDALQRARKSEHYGVRQWATDQLTQLEEKK